MKKKFLCLLLAVISAICMFMGVACSNDEEDTPPDVEVSITLDKTSLNLVEDDYEIIVANTVNFDGTVIWSSSDENVATVTNGVVTGILPGSATITAKADDKTATCAVTVTSAGYVPTMSVNGYTTLELYKGDSFVVPVTVTYKANRVAVEDLAVTVEKEEIATATVANGNIKIQTLAVGKTSVTITSSYLGGLMQKTLVVDVKENVSYSFINSKVSAVDGEYLLNIDRAELKGDDTYGDTAVDLGLKFVDDNNEVAVSDIAWENSDDSVLTLNNGVVTAKKVGESVVTATYSTQDKDYIVNLKVVIDPVVFNLDKSTGDNVTLELKEISGNPVIENEKFFNAGSIQSVKIGNVDVFSSQNANDSTITLDSVKLQNAEFGNVNISIETDLLTFNVETVLIDKYIENKTDLESLNTISKVGDTNVWSGYYMLKNDIEYNGNFDDYQIAPYSWTLDFGNVSSGANTGNLGFNGTLDGNGHKIIGLEVGDENEAYAGIFGVLANGATIKNIAFLKAKLEPGKPQFNTSQNKYVGHFSAYLAVLAANVTIDNVMISGTVLSEYRFGVDASGNVPSEGESPASYINISGNMTFGYAASFTANVSNSIIILEKPPVNEANYQTRPTLMGSGYNNVLWGTWQSHYTFPEGVKSASIYTAFTYSTLSVVMDITGFNEYFTRQTSGSNEYFMFDGALPYVDLSSYNGPAAQL